MRKAFENWQNNESGYFMSIWEDMLFCIIYLHCQCNDHVNPVTAECNFPGNSVVGASLSAGMQVWSLVGQLGSHMPHSQKNQNIKQKQYCNKFSKDLKNGSRKKKKKNFNTKITAAIPS